MKHSPLSITILVLMNSLLCDMSSTRDVSPPNLEMFAINQWFNVKLFLYTNIICQSPGAPRCWNHVLIELSECLWRSETAAVVFKMWPCCPQWWRTMCHQGWWGLLLIASKFLVCFIVLKQVTSLEPTTGNGLVPPSCSVVEAPVPHTPWLMSYFLCCVTQSWLYSQRASHMYYTDYTENNNNNNDSGVYITNDLVPLLNWTRTIIPWLELNFYSNIDSSNKKELTFVYMEASVMDLTVIIQMNCQNSCSQTSQLFHLTTWSQHTEAHFT